MSNSRKDEIRLIMKTVSINIDRMTDEDILGQIYSIAQSKHYKSHLTFEEYCVDCAIILTSLPNVMDFKLMQMSLDEYDKWAISIIEKCRYNYYIMNKTKKFRDLQCSN
ncbi:hypothetical protein [Vibrio phage phiKT1024]|nr:hypothetical protein [Vibrio phage phiKT1024]